MFAVILKNSVIASFWFSKIFLEDISQIFRILYIFSNFLLNFIIQFGRFIGIQNKQYNATCNGRNSMANETIANERRGICLSESFSISSS